MNLSEHFTLAEFVRNGRGLPNRPGPDAEDAIREFCAEVLEPLRAKFGAVVITSGYRNPFLNARVGGTPDSYHVANGLRCAADVTVPEVRLVRVFDWLRLESGLPFDKAILERQDGRDATIHIQYRTKACQTITAGVPRRLAYTGQTGGRGKYTPVAVA